MAKKRAGEGWGTVTRVIHLLKNLAETDHVTLKELCGRLGLPPSTVHRLLQLLMAHDFVERSPDGRSYRSGLELFRVASLVVGKTPITDVAAPFLQAVVDACNEVCFFNLYLPHTRRVAIARAVNSSHPLRYDIELLKEGSLLWGATGRAVLAFLSAEEIDAAFEERTPSPVTGRAPAKATLLADLAVIRKRGYACTRGQKMAGAVGIGAPVFGANGRVLGSLCVTVPDMRFRPEDEKVLANLVMTQAKRLGAAISQGDAGARKPARKAA